MVTFFLGLYCSENLFKTGSNYVLSSAESKVNVSLISLSFGRQIETKLFKPKFPSVTHFLRTKSVGEVLIYPLLINTNSTLSMPAYRVLSLEMLSVEVIINESINLYF